MISNVTITSAAIPMMPNMYKITVKAVVTKPGSLNNPNLKPGYPKAALAGGTVMPPNPQSMNPDPAVLNGYYADFTGSAGNYTATVTENWVYMAETGDSSGASVPTPVP